MIILATIPIPVIDPLSVVASFVIGATTAGTTIYYVTKNIKKEKKD
jgi:fructose-specific phosphotransferase system IIC component